MKQIKTWADVIQAVSNKKRTAESVSISGRPHSECAAIDNALDMAISRHHYESAVCGELVHHDIVGV